MNRLIDLFISRLSSQMNQALQNTNLALPMPIRSCFVGLRRSFASTLIILLAFLLAGCESGENANAAKEPQKLTILNWSDYFGSTTLARFTEATGIEVVVDYIDSNEQLVAKLESQPGQYDIAFPSAYAVEILIRKGLLQSVQRGQLRNADNLMPAYRTIAADAKGEWAVPYTVSFTAIGVDRDQVKGPINGYKDFFRAKIGKKLLLLDDMRATVGMALKSNGFSANSTSPAEIETARGQLLDARPNIHIFSSADLTQLMASGEVGLSYAWSGEVIQATKMNPSVNLVTPKEGTLLYIDCMVIPKGSKRPNNARKFIDHILSPEVAAEISNEIMYLMPNTAAEPHLSADAHEIWDVLQTLEDNPKVEQIQYLGEANDLYIDVWNAVKIQ
uniref:Putrescine-binding periplasmic protein n=1 Tax=Candidatus Kentrum sp. DK TaxID=2126562 RepID=A0A450S3C6_9GAMM|nr:MAG: spermidine/putrescine transport system substrate-binding protein [Candidatus Kentron sp. DK]